MKVIKFNKKVSGHDILFNEPYWNSDCGRYRVAKLDCTRPFRVFRRLPGKNGWPYIGVGSGFMDKSDAILAANKHANGIPIE
jgi:hypothetical protein